MMEITIPGYKQLQLEHLVSDYNGTLACDGQLLPRVKEMLTFLAGKLQIHILTADTFRKAEVNLKDIPCQLSILPVENQDIGKLEYVKHLGSEFTVAIGNGRNDLLMLKDATLGIAVVQREGASSEALLTADVVCTDIISALELLVFPLRLVATLRA